MGCNNSKLPPPLQDKKILIKKNSFNSKKCKIALLGSCAVGKTSLATCYCMGPLNKQYVPTVGGVYFKKDLKKESGQEMTLNIWDTAGEEKYRSMASLYYRDADVVMLIFDLTDAKSFEDLEYWVGQLEIRLQRNDLSVVVVGNKVDRNDRQVSKQKIQAWLARHPQFQYIQASALTGERVDKAFDLAAQFLWSKVAINSPKK